MGKLITSKLCDAITGAPARPIIVFVGPSECLSLGFESSAGASFSIKVEGSMSEDIENDNYTTLAGISKADLSTVIGITKAGIYDFGCTGLNFVKISIDELSGGSLTINAALTD